MSETPRRQSVENEFRQGVVPEHALANLHNAQTPLVHGTPRRHGQPVPLLTPPTPAYALHSRNTAPHYVEGLTSERQLRAAVLRTRQQQLAVPLSHGTYGLGNLGFNPDPDLTGFEPLEETLAEVPHPFADTSFPSSASTQASAHSSSEYASIPSPPALFSPPHSIPPLESSSEAEETPETEPSDVETSDTESSGESDDDSSSVTSVSMPNGGHDNEDDGNLLGDVVPPFIPVAQPMAHQPQADEQPQAQPQVPQPFFRNINAALNQVPKFTGTEKPEQWLRDFAAICETFGYRTLQDQHAIFKYSQKDKAKIWLDVLLNQQPQISAQDLRRAWQRKYITGDRRQIRNKAKRAFETAKKSSDQSYVDFGHYLQYLAMDMQPRPTLLDIIDQCIQGIPSEGKEKLLDKRPRTSQHFFNTLEVLDDIDAERGIYPRSRSPSKERKKRSTRSSTSSKATKKKKDKDSSKKKKKVSVSSVQIDTTDSEVVSSESEDETTNRLDGISGQIDDLSSQVTKLTVCTNLIAAGENKKSARTHSRSRSHSRETRTRKRHDTPYRHKSRSHSRSRTPTRTRSTHSRKHSRSHSPDKMGKMLSAFMVSFADQAKGRNNNCFECNSPDHYARDCPARTRRFRRERSYSRDRRDRSYSRDRFRRRDYSRDNRRDGNRSSAPPQDSSSSRTRSEN